MKKSRTSGSVPLIRPRFGFGLFEKVFGGRPFMDVAKEMVVNARDWVRDKVTSEIEVITNESRDQIRFIDNGKGMDEDNRNAFASVNLTTAGRPGQSGKFCTGTKRFLYSQADSVVVLTAPLDDPAHVYRFSFTRNEYEKMALKEKDFPPERLKKTADTWPHAFKFGTDIIYTLRKPGRKAILRGKALAEAFSARLPMKFSGILKVDGEYIPTKRLIGRVCEMTVQDHRQLGPVTLEIYRPEKAAPEEGLRLTSVEIGDVPFRNLYALLPPELRVDELEVYLMNHVCGTVSIPWLDTYAVEERALVSPAIAEDPKIRHLIKLLADYAPEVQRRLKIKVFDHGDASQTTAEIDDFGNRVTQLYAGGQNPPTTHHRETEEERHRQWEEEKDDPSVPPAIRVIGKHEYEVGETIEGTVVLRSDVAAQYKVDDISWQVQQSRARDLVVENGGFRMVAEKLGQGIIEVELPATLHHWIYRYDIVGERVLKMNTPVASIPVNGQLVLMLINGDKAGDVEWKCEGAGRLKSEGHRAFYTATRIGRALVTAVSKKDQSIQASSNITVHGTPEKMLCIRGVWFTYRNVAAPEMPAVIMIEGEDVHRLMINLETPGFQQAVKGGALAVHLAHLVSTEFPLFILQRQHGGDLTRILPADIPGIVGEMTVDQRDIFGEITGGKPLSE